jgi:hypothetical protein
MLTGGLQDMSKLLLLSASYFVDGAGVIAIAVSDCVKQGSGYVAR